jgi:hypothetical protein
MEEDWTGFGDLVDNPSVERFVQELAFCFGRCFVTTKDGHVGLAPLGAQPGDIISVILWCDFSVILREVPSSSTKPDKTRWKVVGVCYVNGLMSGEATYRSLPSLYRAIRRAEAPDDKRVRSYASGGYADALLDSRTNNLRTDPAAMLEEFRIQPSAKTQGPHRLVVSKFMLREAGV